MFVIVKDRVSNAYVKQQISGATEIRSPIGHEAPLSPGRPLSEKVGMVAAAAEEPMQTPLPTTGGAPMAGPLGIAAFLFGSKK
jgi:hypothetical protein